jgi:hypothetical protein
MEMELRELQILAVAQVGLLLTVVCQTTQVAQAAQA